MPHTRFSVAIITVINVLSGLRLGLAVTFPLVETRFWIAMIVAAGLSDFVDGYLARRFDGATWIGGLLDAVADKAMTLSVLLSMTAAGYFAWWQMLLLLLRDTTVAGIAGYAVSIREWSAFRKMPSRLLGKATTAAVILTFLAALGSKDPHGLAADALFALAVMLSSAAAVDYFLLFRRELEAWRAQKLAVSR